MKVRLVCYENVGEWIIGKFASRLNEELQALGADSEIGISPDPQADVNHHLLYLGYENRKTSIDTLMVTHIDTMYKMRLLRKQLKTAESGICLSRDTMAKLVSAGLPRHKLCYIHPAHDGIIKSRPLLIGITCRVYGDGRKREYFLEKICRLIKPSDFRFWIMGRGWDSEVAKIRTLGFSVDYHAEFDGRLYDLTIPALDYFLYFGLDEGSMGFLDALAAGVKTIATPVGYQADLSARITFKIRNFSDLENVFDTINSERKISAAAVAAWTWENYARKHLLLWDYLLDGRDKGFLERNRGQFPDGLATLNNKEPFLPKRLFRKVIFLKAIVANSLKRRFGRISGKSRQ